LPKRKIKEEKPKKRLGKKELLIVPIAMGGASLLALVIIPIFAPPPQPISVCLKAHGTEQFQIYSRVQVVVDGEQRLLPDDVGKQPKDGKDCIRPIHTDKVGEEVHIEYIRPVRFFLADFMKVYTYDNKTITVIDNSTGFEEKEQLDTSNYKIRYYYYSEGEQFTEIADPAADPPFTKNSLFKIELVQSLNDEG
jgi:hypothetical protein